MFSFDKKKQKNDAPRRRQSSGHAGDERRERAQERESEQHYIFRRNRTLTGSSSNHIDSAAALSGDLQSSRTHAHHLHLQRRKIMTMLGGIVVVCGFIGALIFNFTATPVVSSPDNSVSLEAARYEKVLDSYLSNYPFERFRFVFSNERLNNYLQSATPEIERVRQEGFAGFGKSDFKIEMRKPVAGWVIGGKQYFVDAAGIPFEKNYYASPSVEILDQSGVPQETGTAIASTRFLAFVGRVVSEADARGLIVEKAIIPSGTTRQLEVQIQGRGYPVKLSLDRGAAVQVEDMQKALQYFDSKGQAPRYIDVRVSGKAFYQ